MFKKEIYTWCTLKGPYEDVMKRCPLVWACRGHKAVYMIIQQMHFFISGGKVQNLGKD